jgi:acyl-CoA reductase-like NAD-dependent aldehyde dehydrogenase
MESVRVTIDDLYKVYFWGMAEGQLLMEEERDSEEWFDAAVCAAGSRKFCIPTTSVQRRQVHSEKWFETMRKAKKEFNEFIKIKIKETA